MSSTLLALTLSGCVGSAVTISEDSAGEDTEAAPPGGLDTDVDTDADADTDTDTGLPDPEGDPATIGLEGMCALDERLGAFAVEVQQDYSTVYGSVSDGVVPVTVLEEVASEGDCRLMFKENLYCDPPCAAGQTCDFDGECIPYPETQDLGQVTVAGLDADVYMDPVSPGYTYFSTSLPHPAFQPGALIELATGGGAYDPMTLHGVGFTPIEVLESDWVVTEGEALSVSWALNEDPIQRAVVFLELNIDQHGTSPITVWCTFEDDGAGEVPRSLIDQLLGAGVTGFPSGKLTRRTEDRLDVDGGCMDFAVASPRTANVSVSGYTPCTSTDDCPPGQECNLKLQICE